MTNRMAIVVALALAALGSLVAVFAVRAEERAYAAAQPAAPALQTGVLLDRIDALERELADLRNRVARGELTASASEPAREPLRDPEAVTVTGTSAERAALEQRVAALERVLRESEERANEGGSGSRPAFLENVPLLNRELLGPQESERSQAEWIAQALAPASTPEEQLQSLRALRHRDQLDGSDARLAILPEMLQLAQTSDDADVRADVWRNLSGLTEPAMLGPLLDALAHDTSTKAREEAAETLADFLPDARVEAALRDAMDSDPDRSVRRQAARSLTGG